MIANHPGPEEAKNETSTKFHRWNKDLMLNYRVCPHQTTLFFQVEKFYFIHHQTILPIAFWFIQVVFHRSCSIFHHISYALHQTLDRKLISVHNPLGNGPCKWWTSTQIFTCTFAGLGWVHKPIPSHFSAACHHCYHCFVQPKRLEPLRYTIQLYN